MDRNKNLQDASFDNVPIITDLSALLELRYDYIFTTVVDAPEVHRELNRAYSVPYEKMISMHSTSTFHPGKFITFTALANEIARLNVPGSVVELGVDFGDTAKYINLLFPGRTFYLFDTFSGFDSGDLKFEKQKGVLIDRVTSIYDKRSNAQDVYERMYHKESCVIKQGYFPDSLNGLEDTFAFVHIDCDLQKPIAAALEYFYPRVSEGGYICVHDYFNPHFPGVREVVREFTARVNAKFMPSPHYSGVIINK